MTLLEVQRKMAADIMRPRTSRPRGAGYIKPNDRSSSTERLEIYHRQYWYRLIDSMHEDFPGLRAVLGQRAFGRLIDAYLAECPSASFTLRDLGSRLEPWLSRNPGYAGERFPLALDMVRLEWAHIVALDGASGIVLGPEDLLEPGPDLRISLQPYLSLLHLRYPVDDIRIRVNATLEEQDTASNAAVAHEHRSGALRAGRARPREVYVAVHRWDLTVYYRRLSGEEYRLLVALRSGQAISEAIDTAFAGSSLAIGEIQQLLTSSFALWCELEWLCRP